HLLACPRAPPCATLISRFVRSCITSMHSSIQARPHTHSYPSFKPCLHHFGPIFSLLESSWLLAFLSQGSGTHFRIIPAPFENVLALKDSSSTIQTSGTLSSISRPLCSSYSRSSTTLTMPLLSTSSFTSSTFLSSPRPSSITITLTPASSTTSTSAKVLTWTSIISSTSVSLTSST
ncbi:Unknown protein, partial [Striga hermonthica]